MKVVTTESIFLTCHIRTLDVSSWTSGRLTFLHGTQNQASKGGQAAGWPEFKDHQDPMGISQEGEDIEHWRLRKQTTIGLLRLDFFKLHRTCPEGVAFCPLAIQSRSMDGIFTYVWFVFMVNVGKYTPHGCIGLIIHPLTTHNGKFVGKVDNELSKASHTNKTWVALLRNYTTNLNHYNHWLIFLCRFLSILLMESVLHQLI